MSSEVPVQLSDLIVYSVTDAALAELHSKYIGLRVLDAEDEEGYAQCKEARKIVRDTRLGVEERRKELKAESLAFGKAVDAEAKRIFGKIEAVEGHLVAQLAIVDDEKKRREEAAAQAAQERTHARIQKLQAVRAEVDFTTIPNMSEECFELCLAEWTYHHEVDQKREAAEKARLEQLEAERLESAKLLESERQRIRALEAEAQKMRQEALERETAELRKQQAEAAEIAAKAKAERDAAEAKARAEKLATERAEIEAAAKIADAVMFEEIRTNYPTVEAAWVEIARLRKLLGELATDMGRVLDGPVFNPLGNGGVHPAVRD